jgi:hypothetical protein
VFQRIDAAADDWGEAGETESADSDDNEDEDDAAGRFGWVGGAAGPACEGPTLPPPMATAATTSLVRLATCRRGRAAGASRGVG